MLDFEPARHAPPCTQTTSAVRALALGRWRSSLRALPSTVAYSMSRIGSGPPAPAFASTPARRRMANLVATLMSLATGCLRLRGNIVGLHGLRLDVRGIWRDP